MRIVPSKLFAEHHDAFLKEHYIAKGGRWTQEALNLKFGTEFKIQQIWDRARILGLKIKPGKTPQNMPQPRWERAPEDFIGPVPYVEGGYLILGYLGFRRHNGGSIAHMYKVICTCCRKESTVIQSTIIKAMRRDKKGCSKCVRKMHAGELDRVRRETHAAILAERDAWVSQMMQIPAVSVDQLPENRRFDSQRGMGAL